MKLDLSDVKEYGLSVSGIAISSVASLYLYLLGNPVFALTIVGTVLQVINSWPKSADIVLSTVEVAVGTLTAQTTGTHVDLDFFNRGRENGQLLRILRLKLNDNPYWDTTSRIESTSFPIRIEPKQHEFVRVSIQFNRKTPIHPPTFQTNMNIDFEVSSRKGSKVVAGEFKIVVG